MSATEDAPAIHITRPEAPEAKPGSIQDVLRRKREEALKRTDETFDVPGYGGMLRVRLRALGWKKTRDIMAAAAEQRLDDATRELYVAADTLIAASVDVLAIDEGEQRSLGMGLGLELGRWLGDTAAENDRQAMLVGVFPGEFGEEGMMQLLGEWRAWQQGAINRVDQAQPGN